MRVYERGQMVIYLIIAILVAASFFFVGGLKYKAPKGITPPNTVYKDEDIEKVAPFSKKENVQLESLNFCKRVEGDVPVCYPRNAGFCCQPSWAQVICKQQQCVGTIEADESNWIKTISKQNGQTECEWFENPIGYPGGGHPGFPVQEWCKSCQYDEGFLCWGKPVVLLYPTEPTLVDVEVETSGEIYVSDPLYPAGGWKNVLANPDGSLVYNGKNYVELFYESKVKNYGTPPTGLVFKTSELEAKLPELLFNLGLNYNKTEIPEFMDFWLPKLKELSSKYIFVSLIEKEVKEKNDKVIINPEPDTRIELIIYFKPLNKNVSVTPLEIGERPIRTGFTMVEWGGTIDN